MAVPQLGRRDALLKAKCRALVRSRWGDVVDRGVDAALPGGAAVAADSRAWVLAEEAPERALGGALAWATRRNGASGELDVMATGSAGALARRAAWLTTPIRVWPIEGSGLADQPARPEPIAPAAAPDPRVEPLRAVFERAGAESVVEGGVLRAEVLGLEVARAEIDVEGPRMAVGVGKHDREAQEEIHGRNQGVDQLFEVVRIVTEHRVHDGAGHAAFHLAPERWLRSVVVSRPDLVGARDLTAVPSPVRRDDLRQSAPAPAAGTDHNGEPLLVVCSVGVDLDLVPVAIDAWLADGRKPRLVLCLPEGDDREVTRDLAALVRVPTEVRTVPPDWRVRPRP